MKLKGEIIELGLNEVQAFDEDMIAAYSYAAGGACGEGGGIVIISKDNCQYHFNYVELGIGPWHPKNNQEYVSFYMGLGNQLYVKPEYVPYITARLSEHEGEKFYPNVPLYKNWVQWMQEIVLKEGGSAMVDLKLDVDNGTITSIYDVDEIDGELVEMKGRLSIPKDVTNLDSEALINLDPLAIEVEEGNEAFFARNNCLIRKDGNVLVMGCSNSVIPDDGAVREIGACAFNIPFDLSEMNLNPLVIPDSVKKIGYRAFAVISNNPIHFVVSKGVESISAMAFMAGSEAGPVTVTIEGDPELEAGVFGTKAESRDSDFDIYKTLPENIFTNIDNLVVRCHKGSSVENYCEKYGINCEII